MTETNVERYIRVLTNAVDFVESQNKEERTENFVQLSPAATREIIEILKNSVSKSVFFELLEKYRHEERALIDEYSGNSVIAYGVLDDEIEEWKRKAGWIG